MKKPDEEYHPSQSPLCYDPNVKIERIDSIGSLIIFFMAPAMFISSIFFMAYAGFGAGGCVARSTNYFCSPYGLIATYIFFLVFVIFVLMSPFRKAIRNTLHTAAMIPWYFLLLVLIPQMGDASTLPLMAFIGFLYSLKYICEPLSSKIVVAYKKL